MDAIKLLKNDHDEVEKLFSTYEKVSDGAFSTKQALFDEIRRLLEAHAAIEEQIFYPTLAAARVGSDARDLVLEAQEEHAQVKTLLLDLSDMEPMEETYDAKMKVLHDNIQHHVKEEEGQMFKEAKKVLEKEQLEDLGLRMEALKRELLEDLDLDVPSIDAYDGDLPARGTLA